MAKYNEGDLINMSHMYKRSGNLRLAFKDIEIAGLGFENDERIIVPLHDSNGNIRGGIDDIGLPSTKDFLLAGD